MKEKELSGNTTAAAPAADSPQLPSIALLKLVDVGGGGVSGGSSGMLTVTHWQVDSPGAVAVAGIVSRESGAQYHALHLLCNSATLSWQRGAHEAFN